MQLSQWLSFEQRRLYTAQIWMRAQGPMSVTIMLRKGGYPYTSYVSTTVGVTTEWELYQVTGLTFTTDGVFMIRSESPGTLWVDDASLTYAQWTAPSPPDNPIPSTYFGIHFHSPELPWPDANLNYHTVRIWDAAQWATINTSPGMYYWNELDLHVERALANGADIIFNLGRTPRWASARPNEYSHYGSGQAAEPALDQFWQDWVTEVGTRYQGQITYWEIWNEPNDAGFFTGTPEKLASLAQQARDILKNIDPANQMISPSPYDPGYLNLYFEVGGGHFADIIGYHFYVYDDPELLFDSFIPLVRVIMENHGLQDRPLWDTENGWPEPPVLPEEDGVGCVARLALLDWASSIERYYFYVWDSPGGSGVDLAELPDYTTLTAAGIAQCEISQWMIGSRMLEIDTAADGIWTIRLNRPGSGDAYIVWNPVQACVFNVPVAWNIQQMRDLAGGVMDIGEEHMIVIDQRPIMLEQNEISSVDPTTDSSDHRFTWMSPNPNFNGFKIRLTMSHATSVSLSVYDLQGRRVAIINDGAREAGDHVLQWNGKRTNGENAASGVYFVRMEADGFDVTRKFVLVR